MRKRLILAGGLLCMSVLGGATAWAQPAPAPYLPAILLLLLDDSPTINAAPTVSITAPTNNAVFQAPAMVNLTATAADSYGTVSKVEFYRDTTLIATVTTPSSGTSSSGTYTASDPGVAIGNYSYTAKAYDNFVRVTTSAAVNVTVVTEPVGAAPIYFIYPDQLNTPRAITNAQGSTVWTWANNDPFGNNAPNENPSGLGTFTMNLRFPGQYFDRETNTHYNYYRDYDPAIGRYIQSDPIGLAGGINTYAYVYDNPIKFTDPKGLDTYICTRPLRWNTPFGTIGINVGPFHHQYVCTVSDLNGQVICGSITASGSIFGSPASPTGPNNNDVYEPTQCQFVAPPNACLENCIASKLRGDLPIYDVRAGTRFGNSGAQQCQTFTNNVFGSCEQQCGLR
jgi:RHS repeat-associated protein